MQFRLSFGFRLFVGCISSSPRRHGHRRLRYGLPLSCAKSNLTNHTSLDSSYTGQVKLSFVRFNQTMVNYLMTHLGLETKDHLTAVGDLIWPPLTG